MDTCRVAECESPSRAHGLCQKHYLRQRAGKPLEGPTKKGPAKVYEACGVAGCTQKHRSRGLCATHAYRLVKGLPETGWEAKSCAAADCASKAWAKGLCVKHYMRSRRCTSEGCSEMVSRKGLCAKHHTRAYGVIRELEKDKPCSISGCGLPRRGNGLCTAHKAQRWAKANPDRICAHSSARKTRVTKAGGSYTREEWAALLDYYGHRCRHCASDGKLTVDHIVPVILGGTSNLDNLAPLCGRCNSKKRTKVNFY